jgi:FkbM family methyltransferase
MRKVFIDGGSHAGESVDLFRASFSDSEEYEIHCFEPNPVHKKILTKKDVTYYPKAIWIKYGKIDFYGTDEIERRNVGCTVSKEKTDISHKDPVKVPGICFSSWLKKTFSKDDYIIVKLDIEGAEYKVLNQLLTTGAINYINHLYVEFHHQWMPAVTVEEHTTMVERLKAKGKDPKFWDALTPSFRPELPVDEDEQVNIEQPPEKEYKILNKMADYSALVSEQPDDEESEFRRRYLLGLI